MAANDIPLPAAPPSVWQDMMFLSELRDEIGRPAMPDRDGMDLLNDRGFKPRPPADPPWLIWVMVLACILVVLSLPLIIVLNLRG